MLGAWLEIEAWGSTYRMIVRELDIVGLWGEFITIDRYNGLPANTGRDRNAPGLFPWSKITRIQRL
jgi:hypothetical protein